MTPQAALDSEVFSPAGEPAEAIASVEAIQAAIARGEDPTQALPPTAAGPAAGGVAGEDSGNDFVLVPFEGQSATPDSGAPTDGPGVAFSPTQPELLFLDSVPTVSPNDEVQLDDDVLEGNPGGIGDVDPDQVNTSGTLGFSFGADGPGSVQWLTTGAPAGFTYERSGDDLLIKQDGVTVITVTLNTATGAYTVTQDNPIDHPPGSDENDVSFTLTYQVSDVGGDTANGTLTINVDDDTPTIALAVETEPVGATVHEDGLSTELGDAGDLSEGIREGGLTTASDEAAGLSGSLAGLVTVSAGADQPATGPVFGLSSDTSGLPSLYSKGEAVSYNVVGNVLTATAGGRTVFTLTVNADGSWTFDLDDQLDHIDDGNAANGEGDTETALFTGLGQDEQPTSVDAIDFSSIITASVTDADGDTASLTGLGEGDFTIVVENDVPVLADVRNVVGVVEEEHATVDGIGNEDVSAVPDLDRDTGGNPNRTTAQATGSLSSLVSVGADEPGSFALKADLAGVTLPTLSSMGEAVSYSVTGNTLTASTESRDIFTLQVAPDGGYTFTLLDQLDHAPPSGEATSVENLRKLDFSDAVVFTDADGDSIDLGHRSFLIKVIDDTPLAVSDSGTADPEETITGNVITGGAVGDIADLPGADEPVVMYSISFTDGDGVTTAKVFGGDTPDGTDLTHGAYFLILGDHGLLTIYEDGFYSYESGDDDNGSYAEDSDEGSYGHDCEEDGDGTDVFNYAIVDADGDRSAATLTIESEGEPNLLNLQIVTNSNPDTQFLLVEFDQDDAHFETIIALDEQGQQKIAYTFVFDVGFDIDPDEVYDLSIKYLGPDDGNGNQDINITDLIVEGTEIVAETGNIQIGDLKDDGFDVTIQPGTATYTLQDGDYFNRVDQEGRGRSADTLNGTDDADDALDGRSGRDDLYGADGYDLLLGGRGHDYLEGGDGNDGLTGGSGVDFLYPRNGS